MLWRRSQGQTWLGARCSALFYQGSVSVTFRKMDGLHLEVLNAPYLSGESMKDS